MGAGSVVGGDTISAFEVGVRDCSLYRSSSFPPLRPCLFSVAWVVVLIALSTIGEVADLGVRSGLTALSPGLVGTSPGPGSTGTALVNAGRVGVRLGLAKAGADGVVGV